MLTYPYVTHGLGLEETASAHTIICEGPGHSGRIESSLAHTNTSSEAPPRAKTWCAGAAVNIDPLGRARQKMIKSLEAEAAHQPKNNQNICPSCRQDTFL